MRHRFFCLFVIIFLGPVLDAGHQNASTAYAQFSNRPNISGEAPRITKSKGRDAINKVMELQAKVFMLIGQESQDIALMNRMLDQSYGIQAHAIGMMERLRAADRFNDPIKARLIQDMYNWGKPGTLSVKSDISLGNYSGALDRLRKLRGLHQQVATVFY